MSRRDIVGDAQSADLAHILRDTEAWETPRQWQPPAWPPGLQACTCALSSPLGMLQGLTPTTSPEQQLTLGLASGNRNAASPEGKCHYSPRCDFLSWYRETHTPPHESLGEMYISCAAQHSPPWDSNASRYSLSHRLFSHSTPHNLVPYLHFAWKEQATVSSIRNESRTHSNKWGDNKSPNSPLGHDHSSSYGQAELWAHKTGRGLLENRRTCFKDMTQSYNNQGEREVERDILEKLTIAKCWHRSPVNSIGHLPEERKPEREKQDSKMTPKQTELRPLLIPSTTPIHLLSAFTLTCIPKP